MKVSAHPVEGRLTYRGYDINELVEGCTAEQRFGFEEIAWLLLFGKLPTRTQLEKFRELLSRLSGAARIFCRGYDHQGAVAEHHEQTRPFGAGTVFL